MSKNLNLRGKLYRVETTINTIKQYCNDKGIRTLAEFDKVKLTTFDDACLFIYYCLEAGARIDGKPFDLTKENIGDFLTVPDITQFMVIYQQQAQISDNDIKKKNPITRLVRWIFRRRRA